MLNKAIGLVVSVVLTFLVTLVLNTLINYYTSDKGSVSISEPMGVGESMAIVVTIENYSSEALNDLVLEVPRHVSITHISSKPAMAVEEIASVLQGSSKLLKISQIRPRNVSRMLITVPNNSEAGVIRLANLEATGLSLREDDRLKSPLQVAIYSSLLVALLYAAFLAVFFYLLSNHQKEISEELDKRLDDLKNESDKASKDLEEVRDKASKDVEGLRSLLAKQRLLLQTRLRDYAKELSFWRNAVRSLLLQSGGTSPQAEALIAHVTATLGTLGTKANTEESFETLRVASRWLAEAEKDQK